MKIFKVDVYTPASMAMKNSDVIALALCASDKDALPINLRFFFDVSLTLTFSKHISFLAVQFACQEIVAKCS